VRAGLLFPRRGEFVPAILVRIGPGTLCRGHFAERAQALRRAGREVLRPRSPRTWGGVAAVPQDRGAFTLGGPPHVCAWGAKRNGDYSASHAEIPSVLRWKRWAPASQQQNSGSVDLRAVVGPVEIAVI
jgi:hypothetical protein